MSYQPRTATKPLSTRIRISLQLFVLAVLLLCLFVGGRFGEATVSSVECKNVVPFKRFSRMYWFLRWLIYPRDYKNETTFIVYLFKGLPLFEQNEKYHHHRVRNF